MHAATATKLVDLELYLHWSSERAILVSRVDQSQRVWLMLSMIEVRRRSEFLAEVTMPEWLALETGLI